MLVYLLEFSLVRVEVEVHKCFKVNKSILISLLVLGLIEKPLAQTLDDIYQNQKEEHEEERQASFLGKCLASREMLLSMMGMDKNFKKSETYKNNELAVLSIKSAAKMLEVQSGEAHSNSVMVAHHFDKSHEAALDSINVKFKSIMALTVSRETKYEQLLEAALIYDGYCKQSKYLDVHIGGGVAGYYTSKL